MNAHTSRTIPLAPAEYTIITRALKLRIQELDRIDTINRAWEFPDAATHAANLSADTVALLEELNRRWKKADPDQPPPASPGAA